MDQDSAPEPDGFNGRFYRFAWNIIGMDIIAAIVSFFEKNFLPSGLNLSFVVLIPKVKEADRVDLFRPIVLSNFLFKIISKILASRLSIITSRIVSENQFGFINGRRIHDCIGVASKCINCLDRRSYGGNMADKVDIRKAFDTSSWKFLLKALKAFGFRINSAIGFSSFFNRLAFRFLLMGLLTVISVVLMVLGRGTLYLRYYFIWPRRC